MPSQNRVKVKTQFRTFSATGVHVMVASLTRKGGCAVFRHLYERDLISRLQWFWRRFHCDRLMNAWRRCYLAGVASLEIVVDVWGHNYCEHFTNTYYKSRVFESELGQEMIRMCYESAHMDDSSFSSSLPRSARRSATSPLRLGANGSFPL